MRRIRIVASSKWLCCLTVVLLLHVGGLAAQAADTPSVKIAHKPLKSFTAGNRIDVSAEVEDPSGVEQVRCYFRTPGEANFVFVPMKADDSGAYTGRLPAPAADTQAIEYVFLVVNGNTQVFRSQAFTMIRDGNTAAAAAADPVTVYTEIGQMQPPSGFSGSIDLVSTASDDRFGLVVDGLYAGNATSTAAITGLAAGATDGGEVEASTTFWNTTIAIAATAAAVGIGVAAADNGGDDTEAGSPIAGVSPTSLIIDQPYDVSGVYTNGATFAGTINFRNDSTFDYHLSHLSGYHGSWFMTNNVLTMRFDTGDVYSGATTGNEEHFTMVAGNGWTLTFLQ